MPAVRDPAGDRLRLPGRRAGDGVRDHLLAALDRGGGLFHRLHAQPEGARADPVLRLFRHQPRGGGRRCVRRQPVHPGDLLRGPEPRHLSARLSPRGRRGLGRLAEIPRLPDGRVEERPARGAGADLPSGGVARLRAGRAAGGGRRLGDAADRGLLLLPVRVRQGRGDAAARLAARGDGGAHAGQRAAACGRRGQDGRVLRAARGVQCLRHRPDGRRSGWGSPPPIWSPSPS